MAEIAEITQAILSGSFTHLNTLLLIIIAWFVHRQVKAYDEQTKQVNKLLNEFEQRITRLEAFHEAEQL